jgi:hypothetical protein
MGAETATFAMMAVAAGATIGKMSAEKQAEQADLSAINQQAKLQALQYQQKTMQNLELTDKLLSRQAAQMSVRGVAFDSPSFNAIQRETVNAGAKRESNIKTAESIGEQAYELEKKNVKNTFHAKLFGDAADFAFNSINIASKLPKSEDI